MQLKLRNSQEKKCCQKSLEINAEQISRPLVISKYKLID